MLRPRERRRPQMPNQLLADGRGADRRVRARRTPGSGRGGSPRSWRAPKWGGIVVSPNGVWKVLRRHGLNTRAKRLALVAGYRAPYEPPREPAPEPHIDVDRPGELVGIDCFYVGRLHGTDGAVWQLTAIDIYSSFAWAELVVCPHGNPTAAQTSRSPAASPASSQAAGWRLERVLSDNGNEFRSRAFTADARPRSAPATAASTPAARRPTATSKRCTARSSTSAGAPPSRATCYPRYTGLRRDLDAYLALLQPRPRPPRPHSPRGRIPADIVYGARKMEPR